MYSLPYITISMKIIALYDNTMRNSDGRNTLYTVSLAVKVLTQKLENSTREACIWQIIISSPGLPFLGRQVARRLQ
jgi:hypothetical protein